MIEEKKDENRRKKPKRNAKQRLEDFEFITPLALQGVPYSKIAEQLSAARPYTMSKLMVYYDFHEVIKTWQSEHKDIIDKYVAIQLKKIDRIESEAWEAWEKSKRAKNKNKTRQAGVVGADKPDRQIQEDTTEERVGDPRWFDVIFKCDERRRELLKIGTESEGNGLVAYKENRKIVFNVRTRSNDNVEEAVVVTDAQPETIDKHLIA